MRLLTIALLLFATGACVSTGERTTRNRDVLTLEEIQSSDLTDAYEIIRGMRPQWLRVRGPNSFYAANPIMVYLDGNRMGGPEVLSSIPKLSIEEIRFYDPPEAQARFGLNNTNGAIVVRTR